MASDLLHIKDSYYFDVPKTFWKSHRTKASEFPDWFIRLDDDFQDWEADHLIAFLRSSGVDSGHLETLKSDWHAWQHESKHNHSWPLHAYIESQVQSIERDAAKWAKKLDQTPRDPVAAYLAEHGDHNFAWAHGFIRGSSGSAWEAWKAQQLSHQTVAAYLDTSGSRWDSDKLHAYNKSLDGKILIPQPFGSLKNAYEPLSGFCISKFMIIQVAVAVLLIVGFRWLAKKVASGGVPKGKLWNAMEGMLTFVKTGLLVPAMGEHDAEDFQPFFWTVFLFIFGCNLAGMVPFLGSPTAALGMTGVLAIIVFLIGVVLGVREFGVIGFLKNICPQLGLPIYLGIFIVPMLWVIEFASLLIKHFILAMRLLANMVAGHSVLLGIMGLAIGTHAYAMSTMKWSTATVLSLAMTTALSVLELFIAFLQAAIFTFLGGLFISSAKHHH